MCDLSDRDILSFNIQTIPEPTPVIEISSNTQMNVVGVEQDNSNLYPFVQSIMSSSIIPTNALESLALATHAILLCHGFICICERDTGGKQVTGFAPPLSGEIIYLSES